MFTFVRLVLVPVKSNDELTCKRLQKYFPIIFNLIVARISNQFS